MEAQFMDVDTFTSQIFSILENKFLFGYEHHQEEARDLKKNNFSFSSSSGKVRILSIDGHGSTDGILAAKSLFHLEASLRLKFNDPDARIADFFDVAAGSGVGGILAALLFTKGRDGRPIFTAQEALNFLIQNRRKLTSSSSSRKGIFRRISRHSKAAEKIFHRTFGESTLRDTLKPVLIPCYDLLTRAPFLLSRADAMETDSYNFTMTEVCLATTSTTFQMKSVDKQTKIQAVNCGVAMNNPTAAAITHVLNNKQEFLFCKGVEDLLVVSLGNGESNSDSFVQIAGAGASDMVDQAVSMAFGDFMTNNYVRIQANESSCRANDRKKVEGIAEEMLRQKNVESVLFKGKRMVEKTKLEKLESFAGELIKENERRKTSIFPTVLFKQVSPRISSATVSTISSSY